MKIRYESFGGIIATDDPPALTFVDKEFLLDFGEEKSELWESPDNKILSAPIEAHYAITNHCTLNCPGCYMASEKMDLKTSDEKVQLKRARVIAKKLADMGIFHVALGGGESFLIPWFFEIAKYFRDLGIIPNVTTSGYGMNDEIAKKCKVFGQVNVSIDGIEDKYNNTRPKGYFKVADTAMKKLIFNDIRTGINSIITSKNFDRLEDIIQYAKKIGSTDIEFLRFKPVGRGKEIYKDMALSFEQSIQLFPKLKKLSRKYRVSLKLDCSFTPFICYHNPSQKVMDFFSILGCDAGNWLIGVSPEGEVSPCSFIKDHDIAIEDLQKNWLKDKNFNTFRDWKNKTKSICKECKYLTICQGGCHAVSYFLTGSYDNSDPECPIIIEKLLKR